MIIPTRLRRVEYGITCEAHLAKRTREGRVNPWCPSVLLEKKKKLRKSFHSEDKSWTRRFRTSLLKTTESRTRNFGFHVIRIFPRAMFEICPGENFIDNLDHHFECDYSYSSSIFFPTQVWSATLIFVLRTSIYPSSLPH